MSNYIYALLNSASICVAVSKLTENITAPNTIKLDTFDTTILGKKYNKGVWEVVPEIPEPEPEPQPTQLDIIQEQVYINNESNLILMEAMADQYEQTEAYRLNDMEVQATTYEAVLALSQGGKTI